MSETEQIRRLVKKYGLQYETEAFDGVTVRKETCWLLSCKLNATEEKAVVHSIKEADDVLRRWKEQLDKKVLGRECEERVRLLKLRKSKPDEPATAGAAADKRPMGRKLRKSKPDEPAAPYPSPTVKIKHKDGKWVWGEKSRLCAALGIKNTKLSEILSGRIACSPKLAAKIESITGGQITRMDLLYRAESTNPLLNPPSLKPRK